MWSNGNSFNGASTYTCGDALNEPWRTFPWWFRHTVAQAGMTK